jgi:hypothetical protein
MGRGILKILKENNMKDYFSAPEMCQSKSGGVYDYVCEHHAKKTGGRSVCLFNKNWHTIFPEFKCPNKDWQNTRIPLPTISNNLPD